ncbi:MAG TPA: BlaI/MecI/CopY family transcriptional regulator [Terracidiphilus sp.]|jgi:predicted transcriptional regulator|nr:BlaI/MecI/CopY family transcriptional regulator [Terracidiphilus sp.]
MRLPRLSKLELQIMETFWTRGACSVREVQESFSEKNRPAFTTVQTMIYRLEAKKALRCTKRIGKANIFEAVISRIGVQRNLIDELLNLFGTRPVVAHMVKTGQLTLDDVRDAEQELKRLARKEQSK